MKKITSAIIVLMWFCNLNAQKKEIIQKLVFKTEIQPLLDNSKIEEALPLIKKYFNQNLILGEIWTPKVMLLEANNMYLSEKLLAVNHDQKAFQKFSVAHADTSIFWYKRMLLDRHQDSLLAKERLNILTEARKQFPIQLVEIQKQRELQIANRNKFIADSLESVRVEKEKRELFVKDSLNASKKIQEELNDYVNSKKVNKIQNYKLFLKKYPESEYYVEIDTLCSKLGMKKADSLHTFQAYKEFIDSFPTSTYISEVTDKLLKLACPQSPSSIKTLVEVNKIINEIRLIDSKLSLGFDFKNKNIYSTVNLNSGNWTFKNLNVSHFVNGDTIPQAITNQDWEKAAREKKPAWCYYENNSDNQYVHGKLYNWYALSDPRGLATSNYVIPNIELYEGLVLDAGGASNAITSLKCLDAWQNEEYSDVSIGFDATPSGFRDEKGNFLNKDVSSRFWSKDENGSEAYFFGIDKKENTNNLLIKSEASKGFGYSIRLVALYEESEYTYSELLSELMKKRDELLLKEYGQLKESRKIDLFVLNQLRNELNIKNLSDDELDNAHFNFLIRRFYFNDEIEKNGNFFIPPFRSEQSSCSSDGSEDVPNPKIIHGFKNNVHNYIKWLDGSTYTGEISEGIPNGKGVLIIGANCEEVKNRGNVLEGDFVDGYMASGIIKYKDKRVYQGSCNFNNEPNGNGTMIFANGTKQSGEFIDGEFQKGFECKKAVIGTQTWMAENLSVTKFRNGDPIPEAKTWQEWVNAKEKGQPAFCYANNDPSNVSKYGVLYNWHAVNDSRGLAPKGWRVPNEKDYQQLKYGLQPEINKKDAEIEKLKSQGASGLTIQKLENERQTQLRDSKWVNGIKMASVFLPGYKLKTTSGWYNSLDKKANWNGNNKFGFNAEPSFHRNILGSFNDPAINLATQDCNFWLSTSLSRDRAAAMKIDQIGDLFIIGRDKWLENTPGDEKGTGYPVRLIKE